MAIYDRTSILSPNILSAFSCSQNLFYCLF